MQRSMIPTMIMRFEAELFFLHYPTFSRREIGIADSAKLEKVKITAIGGDYDEICH